MPVTEPQKRSSDEILQKAKRLIRTSRFGPALGLLEDGVEAYPDDPFMLSYYGCLVSMVEKRHAMGIKICREAIAKLQDQDPEGCKAHFPVLYMNLGKAYLAGKKKKEAVEAFRMGLKQDPKNWDLILVMKKLGTRRPPPLSFLDRNNPFNKFLGKLSAKFSRKIPTV